MSTIINIIAIPTVVFIGLYCIGLTMFRNKVQRYKFYYAIAPSVFNKIDLFGVKEFIKLNDNNSGKFFEMVYSQGGGKWLSEVAV